MSQSSGFNPIDLTNNEIDKKIANALTRLVNDLCNETDFNEKELKAISVMLTDEYLGEYLEIYLSNKKHIKGKHTSNVLKGIKGLGLAISKNSGENSTIRISDKKFYR